MTVCQFFQRGYCKFGDKCRYEHPARGESNPFASRNPFDTLGGNNPRGVINRPQDQSSNHDKSYHLDANIIRTDLAKELPQWILSAYGPGRNAPLQLFGGYPREQSFEEMRYRHYQLAASGNQQQAVQEAQELLNNAERQVWTVLNDINGAIQYVIDGEKQHPNRLDIVQGALPQQPQLQGNNYPNSTSGQISAFGNKSSGASLPRPSTSFGQPSAPAFSFGQPSALGPPKSVFGQPTSTFGQPAGLSQPGGGILGQAPSSVPTFAQQIENSPFGQVRGGFPVAGTTVSGPQQANPFGQAAPPQSSNPFGQQPSIGNPPVNSFGQSASANPNPFGLAGNAQNPTTSNQRAGPSGTFNQPISQAGRTGIPSTTITKGSATPVDAKRDSQGRLISWNGNPVQLIDDDVCYRDTDGSWKKIWFPDGPPVLKKAVELPDTAYDEATKANYQYLKEHGTFKNGRIPELPPKREWCNWNF